MRKIALVLMCLLWCATSCLSSEKIDVYTLAERGTLEQLQEALENGAKFNVSRATKAEGDEEIATDWWFFDGGETPLHHAAAYNHNPESIRFLIAQSIDVNATAGNGRMLYETPLSRAIRYKNLEATLELLKAGADPNFWSLGEGSNGNMLDIVAIEYLDDNYATKTVIDALMKAGAKINDHYEAEQEEKKAMLLPRR
ncbi:MAG: ankyrin repeat domain-containing protein, partial [Synergistaceae bacterium]|nr:ankyrin repeat domain-containing protein [Synergistaceae bacterium]